MTTKFTVIYDACVLYPNTLRDLLMELATRDIFQAKWTDEIHAEWIRNLHQNRPDIPLEKLYRLRDLMNQNVRDCLVTGYEYLIPNLNLPDAQDRHVLAAAIAVSANIIVSSNIKDFPDRELSQYNIIVQHQDAFLANLIELNSAEVVEAVLTCQQRRKQPPCSVPEYLLKLHNQELPVTVSKLKNLLEKS